MRLTNERRQLRVTCSTLRQSPATAGAD